MAKKQAIRVRPGMTIYVVSARVDMTLLQEIRGVNKVIAFFCFPGQVAYTETSCGGCSQHGHCWSPCDMFLWGWAHVDWTRQQAARIISIRMRVKKRSMGNPGKALGPLPHVGH